MLEFGLYLIFLTFANLSSDSAHMVFLDFAKLGSNSAMSSDLGSKLITSTFAKLDSNSALSSVTAHI